MNVLGSLPFGLTVPEIGVLAVGVGYIVTLVRDWRPIKQLRAENGDLRSALADAQGKIAALEQQVKSLEKATDLSSLVTEHAKIADVLDRVVARLDSLDGAVHANTAVIEAVARGSSLKQTLDDMEDERRRR